MNYHSFLLGAADRGVVNAVLEHTVLTGVFNDLTGVNSDINCDDSTIKHKL